MNETAMIGYCGLICSKCEGYLATQANDTATLERLAAQARESYGVADASVETVACDGCLSQGRLCAYCKVCDIRACASAKAVAHCGECSEFESCERINKFMEMVPETRETFALLRH